MKELSNNLEIKEWYVSHFQAFENSLNGSGKVPFHQIRRSAIAKFADLGFPGRRDEEWKYTNLTPLLKHKFPVAARTTSLPADTVRQFVFKGLAENLLVFVNGRYSRELSNYRVSENGVSVDSLENALKNQPERVAAYLAKYAPFEKESFVALNTAFAVDGAFIYVPDDVIVEQPVHLLYISEVSAGSHFASPRNLIVAGRNSQVKIVESYHGVGENPYFNNVVTEAAVNENARVDHIRIQDENLSAYHVYSLETHQQQNSVYWMVNVDMGGALVRNNLTLTLDAENCEGHLLGFYMADGRQHIDNHTAIDHAKPNCFSNELYKGILSGKAKGVFNGKIFVRRDAQKTNAYQNNKALLLSEDATINSKPQLEIFADDVKCSHGATVGQLDSEALFYLRSRGIPQEQANSILQYAFASEVFGYITIDSVREHLEEIIEERFARL